MFVKCVDGCVGFGFDVGDGYAGAASVDYAEIVGVDSKFMFLYRFYN